MAILDIQITFWKMIITETKVIDWEIKTFKREIWMTENWFVEYWKKEIINQTKENLEEERKSFTSLEIKR